MIHNPVIWFEIYVQDMGRARAFYEEVFQVKLNRLDSKEIEKWGFPTEMNGTGGSRALVKMPASGGNSSLVYFSCTDCAVEAERAEKAGGAVWGEKFPIGKHGYMVLAADTEGNMIGLHSMK